MLCSLYLTMSANSWQDLPYRPSGPVLGQHGTKEAENGDVSTTAAAPRQSQPRCPWRCRPHVGFHHTNRRLSACSTASFRQSTRQTLVEVAGRHRRNTRPYTGIALHHHGVQCRLGGKVHLL